MRDCHHVPLPEQRAAIYLHKWTGVNHGAAQRYSVHRVSNWPLWFVFTIVSQCSFTAGVVLEPMSFFFFFFPFLSVFLFFANNGSEVFPVISFPEVYLFFSKKKKGKKKRVQYHNHLFPPRSLVVRRFTCELVKAFSQCIFPTLP